MEKEKKKFIIPEAEMIGFTGEDIITTSDRADWWLDDTDGEDLQ